eukprot:Skav200757  [mRNA]  locus=scaffold1117:674257:680265:+ [translate_table: standard]
MRGSCAVSAHRRARKPVQRHWLHEGPAQCSATKRSPVNAEETVLSAYEKAHHLAAKSCQFWVGENKVLPSDLVSSSGKTGLVLVVADTECSVQLVHLGDKLRAGFVSKYESVQQSFEALSTDQKIGQEQLCEKMGCSTEGAAAWRTLVVDGSGLDSGTWKTLVAVHLELLADAELREAPALDSQVLDRLPRGALVEALDMPTEARRNLAVRQCGVVAAKEAESVQEEYSEQVVENLTHRFGGSALIMAYSMFRPDWEFSQSALSQKSTILAEFGQVPLDQLMTGKHLGSRATVALLEQYLILSQGPSPIDCSGLIRQGVKKWLSKERRCSTTSFVRTGGGVLKQRRRAKRCDVGKKRSQYIKKKPAREGPLRGLTGAEEVGLSHAPEESKAQVSGILDEMSPPKSRRKE